MGILEFIISLDDIPTLKSHPKTILDPFSKKKRVKKKGKYFLMIE